MHQYNGTQRKLKSTPVSPEMITSRHTKETKINTGITRNDNQLKSTSKLYESTVKIRHRKLHIYIHETEKERERTGQEASQSEMGWHRGGGGVE